MMNKGILYKIFIIPLLLIPLVCPFHISADTSITVTYADVKYQEYIVGVNHSPINTDTGATNHLYFEFKGNVYGTITFLDQTNNQTYEFSVSGTSYDFAYTKASNGSYIRSIRIVYTNLYSEKDWDFPIESYSLASYMLKNSSSYLDGLVNVNDYTYPMFLYPKGSNYQIYGFYAYADSTKDFQLLFIGSGNINNQTRFEQYFDIMGTGEGGGTFYDFKRLYTVGMMYDNQNTELGFGYLYSVKVHGSDGFIYIRLIQSLRPSFFMIPVFGNYIDNNYISTDFALRFGLSNQLLDDIHSYVSGSASSETASSNLETVSDDISSSSDDLIQSENSFNSSMNSNLQQIDTNINIGNLGNKFLASAEWVRVQFNTLTNGTPFGSVLSFSLLLGLALVLVGRIRK